MLLLALSLFLSGLLVETHKEPTTKIGTTGHNKDIKPVIAMITGAATARVIAPVEML